MRWCANKEVITVGVLNLLCYGKAWLSWCWIELQGLPSLPQVWLIKPLVKMKEAASILFNVFFLNLQFFKAALPGNACWTRRFESNLRLETSMWVGFSVPTWWMLRIGVFLFLNHFPTRISSKLWVTVLVTFEVSIVLIQNNINKYKHSP